MAVQFMPKLAADGLLGPMTKRARGTVRRTGSEKDVDCWWIIYAAVRWLHLSTHPERHASPVGRLRLSLRKTRAIDKASDRCSVQRGSVHDVANTTDFCSLVMVAMVLERVKASRFVESRSHLPQHRATPHVGLGTCSSTTTSVEKQAMLMQHGTKMAASSHAAPPNFFLSPLVAKLHRVF